MTKAEDMRKTMAMTGPDPSISVMGAPRRRKAPARDGSLLAQAAAMRGLGANTAAALEVAAQYSLTSCGVWACRNDQTGVVRDAETRAPTWTLCMLFGPPRPASLAPVVSFLIDCADGYQKHNIQPRYKI